MNIHIQYGRVGSDSTAPYYVTLDKPMTVGEFIIEWMEMTPGDWGYFKIAKNGTTLGNPSCEYKQGKIIGEKLPDEYLKKTIKNVYGSGGWSNSDFIFEVEEPEKEKSSIEETIEDLQNLYRNDDYGSLHRESIETAIKSLKAWDQVTKEIRKVFEQEEPIAHSWAIGLRHSLRIIYKHLGEVRQDG